ncbi:MAG: hypothetical protein HYS27_06750 [Deltaproteobacteria bacterium]|nr:hypothetical protein [Deltaproteobacteria bacterium]
MLLALALVLAADAAAPEARPAEGAPLFSRVEPAIADGAAALGGGDAAKALELFRQAKADTPNQRAIVEYDVGQALAAQALATAQQQAPAAPSGGAPDPATAAAPPQLDPSAVADAQAAFGRARALAHDPRVKAEAALAGGNLAAMAGDVDEALRQFRQALKDDPMNERAKKNLRRALEAKKQQQQQQQQPNEQNKDDQQQDEQNRDDQQKNEQNKDEQKKDDEQKKNEQNKDDQQKSPEDKQQPQPQGAEPDDKKAQKKDAARRLLDALRARERPLTPLEMRGAKPVRAKEGKDW